MNVFPAESFRYIQLNSGLLVKSLKWEQVRTAAQLEQLVHLAETEGRLLGATRGPGSFSCVPQVKTLPVAGAVSPVKGAVLTEGWDIRLQGTLLQVSPGRIAEMLGGARMKKTDGVTVIAPRDYQDSDYIPRLCWVGDTPAGMVLIELENALNIGGLHLTMEENGAGGMRFCFRAHRSPNGSAVPCRIAFFEV